jgi:pentatricopeptide repeat protein
MTLINALIRSEQAENVEDAMDLVKEMRNRVIEHNEDPEDVLYEYGLEPDYVMDLIGI